VPALETGKPPRPVLAPQVTNEPLQLDALLIGGGIAGLWTLHALLARGYRAILVEPFALGRGQTISSQGIIHGGLKYTLAGLMNPSAEAIREMPAIWRDCLAGQRSPDLSAAGVRAQRCSLWGVGSLRSQAGMIGARIGLRVAPVTLSRSERPTILAQSPGTVARLDEQVIDPGAVLAALARACTGSVLRIDPELGLDFDLPDSGRLRTVTLHAPRSDQTGRPLRAVILRPARIILTAGAGNDLLRRRLGLRGDAMQVRPLRMLLVRGPSSGPGALAELNGHCVDGARTKVTITAALDTPDRRVWQVGGDLAERGATLSHAELLALGRRELLEALPALDTRHLEWTTYRADRAEAATGAGARPDDATVIAEGNILTAWPTKLALAPRLAQRVLDHLPAPAADSQPATGLRPLADWDSPPVARPPWETADGWTADAELA